MTAVRAACSSLAGLERCLDNQGCCLRTRSQRQHPPTSKRSSGMLSGCGMGLLPTAQLLPQPAMMSTYVL